jgi:threonine/homoserine/homoserine lactone efflux protein
MPDLTLWRLFIVASVVVLLTPGPAVLFIIARSLEQGRAAGLVSVLGIHLGTIVHITAAAIGLSALLVSSALTFAVVKYLGAAYLIWIGIRTLLAKDPDPEAPAAPAEPRLPRRLRCQPLQPEDGDLLPCLPAAVRRPRARRGALADPLLGLTFMGLGIMSDGMFALVAGTAGDVLRCNRRFLRFQRRFAGTAFIGLGVTAALATRK